MDHIKTWRNLVLANGLQKGLDLLRFQNLDGFHYWWFGTYQYGASLDHVYFELWEHPDKLDWEIFGATFNSHSTGIHLGIEPHVIKPLLEKTNRSRNLYFYMLNPGHWTKYNCTIRLKEDYRHWSLLSIDVSAYDGPSYPLATRRKSRLWHEREEFNIESDAEFAKLAYPECYGVGTRIEFSIPKADFANALSGYDRYSSNKVCGVSACTSCGGKGVQYQKWYVSENPDLPKSSRIFREGTGIVRAPRLPSKW